MNTRIFQTAYGKVYARVTGTGPAVLFIHGRVAPLNSMQTWSANLEVVAQAGFRVIAIDLPGYGEAARPEGAISSASAVDCVLELFDRLPLTRAAVVGHNWGGLIAWRAAIIESNRINKLVLVAAEGAEQISETLSGEISTPTLIVWAEDDSYLPVSNAQQFADAIPNARQYLFPGLSDSGGQPKLTHPGAPHLSGEPFNEVLIQFLKE